MKITTVQLKSLMASKPRRIVVKTFCESSGVGYDALRIRLKGGGSMKPEEEKALGEDFASFLLEDLGWRVEEG